MNKYPETNIGWHYYPIHQEKNFLKNTLNDISNEEADDKTILTPIVDYKKLVDYLK